MDSCRNGRGTVKALVSFIAGVIMSWALVISEWGVVDVHGDCCCPWALSFVGMVIVHGAGQCH